LPPANFNPGAPWALRDTFDAFAFFSAELELDPGREAPALLPFTDSDLPSDSMLPSKVGTGLRVTRFVDGARRTPGAPAAAADGILEWEPNGSTSTGKD